MNEIIMSPAENLTFISSVWLWGLDVIRMIQRIESPALTVLMKFITALGTELLYFPLILVIYWLVNEKQGFRLGLFIIASVWINAFFKEMFKQPRPFHLEPSLGLVFERGYGAPSGHAQMALCFWIFMALWLSGVWTKKTPGRNTFPVWIPAISFILLIGFTRLYLGVHFPTDLLAGWLLGGIILLLWFIPGARLEKLFAAAGVRPQNIAAAAIALAMNGLYPKDRILPALMLGFCLGYTLMCKSFPFSARGEINGKKPGPKVIFFRLFTGFAGLAVIYLALKLLLPGEGSIILHPLWGPYSPLAEAARFIRYGLLGFWVSGGAPKVFGRMGLSFSEESRREES